MFAGTYDGGVWRRPLSDFAGTMECPEHHALVGCGFTIFLPGGAGSKAAVDFSLPRRERVSFTLYDISGRAVRCLATGQFEAGAGRLSWDTGFMAPGYYAIKMRRGTSTFVKSLLLPQ
jgi:hypothetical protein